MFRHHGDRTVCAPDSEHRYQRRVRQTWFYRGGFVSAGSVLDAAFLDLNSFASFYGGVALGVLSLFLFALPRKRVGYTNGRYGLRYFD